jgi:uncharacterized protein (TIGR03435 family)
LTKPFRRFYIPNCLGDFAPVAGDLTARLSYLLGHLVADGTGLPGKYDFSLTFATGGTALAGAAGPRRPLPPPGGDTPNAADSEPPPDLFSAVQSQTGLRLDARSIPVEVTVIDRLERTPVAN